MILRDYWEGTIKWETTAVPTLLFAISSTARLQGHSLRRNTVARNATPSRTMAMPWMAIMDIVKLESTTTAFRSWCARMTENQPTTTASHDVMDTTAIEDLILQRHTPARHDLRGYRRRVAIPNTVTCYWFASTTRPVQ